jgi:hypothetical protein
VVTLALRQLLRLVREYPREPRPANRRRTGVKIKELSSFVRLLGLAGTGGAVK